jgi:hypothetical protein
VKHDIANCRSEQWSLNPSAQETRDAFDSGVMRNGYDYADYLYATNICDL